MKNQYFGDRRDLFKYDLLLDLVTAHGANRLTIVPMLTANDESGEGNLTHAGARQWHPRLHSFLKQCRSEGHRDIRMLREFMSSQGLILKVYRDSHLFAQGIRTRYFDDIPVDDLTRSVIFIDPDIGLESGAAAYMRRQGPEKYLQYSELLNVSERSSPESVLVVYQHLQSDGRKRRNDISDRIAQIARRLGTRVWAVQWNDVAMIVATRSSDVAARLESSLAQYADRHRLDFYRASVHRTDPQGSCIPTVNSERIGNALQLLNQGLQIFVERSMKGHYGEGWREQADQGRRESPQKHKGPSQTDWDTQAYWQLS